MNDPLVVQETVRRRYAELAVLAPTQTVSCCSDSDNACFGPTGYQGMDEQIRYPTIRWTL